MKYKSELHLQSIIYQAFYTKYPQYRIPSKGMKVKGPRCMLVHNLLNSRSEQAGAKGQATGVTKGFPDMTLYIPGSGYPGLMMELKVENKKPKPEQKEALLCLENQGYFVCWTNCHEEAAEIFEAYLNGTIHQLTLNKI